MEGPPLPLPASELEILESLSLQSRAHPHMTSLLNIISSFVGVTSPKDSGHGTWGHLDAQMISSHNAYLASAESIYPNGPHSQVLG